tara:strand:+ start:1843 stop:2142 length:300 start_codon:yes stop_codon:yes gene_type:complete
MLDLFYEGGILFMSIISFFLLMTFISFYLHNDKLKTYGNLALASGILGSFIGIYSTLGVIQQVGNVSQAILADGFKVAFISLIYGIIVYIVSRLLSIFR